MLILAKYKNLQMQNRSKTKVKITIIVPLYNEEGVVGCFHEQITAVLKSLVSIDWKLFYIIDRCTDKTTDVVREIIRNSKRCQAVCLSSRFGHQASLMAGIESSLDADAIIMMDGDLQHPPNLIPKLIQGFREGMDVVYTVRKGTDRISMIRKMAGNVFYWLINKISDVSINANASDYRLISSRVARHLSDNFAERNLFLRGVFSWMGFNQQKVEYVAAARAGGNSKYSFSRIVKLATVAVVSFSTKPLKIGILIGAVFSLLAFLFLLWIIAYYFSGKSLPSGWATIVVLQLLFSGIQLICIGFLGIYIAGIHEEVKNRPRYLIQDVIK